MKKILATLFWLAVALSGGWAFLTLGMHRGDSINSIYILIAALCSYAIGYRFYSKWLAASVLTLNDRRATPCEVNDDGKDFVKTNKWIVFGHHFAAISGPGPLVGPVLAAQFGYLPGTLWILIGVVLGGAVQDFVILFSSLRRNGKSLGQMVKDEMNTTAGYIAMVAILAIMVILLAVLALVVVNALAESPWGVFTVGATVPIAMLMGGYLRFGRVGKVLEASAFGVVLLLLAVWGGQFVHTHATFAEALTFKPAQLAWAIIIYGLAASVLPIWLLLAPRDYLSTFMKLGTIGALACGIFLVLPELKMPALSRFVDGSGPVVPGKIFPFCFITIACGAISGFHSLIASGTTPKILTRESYARPVGYGAMCLESLVAIMAIIAACTLDPGVYLSMNMKGAPEATVAKVNAWNFPVTTSQMDTLAAQSGEKTLFGRTGGAATLAVGMSQIFAKTVRGHGLDLWYHFAIMFEALFILTTLDADTSGPVFFAGCSRQYLEAACEHKKFTGQFRRKRIDGRGVGLVLIQGVRDPDGGIKALWPLFGMANQMLAAIALCLATTVILKMQIAPDPQSKIANQKSKIRHPAFALVTLIPLIWLLAVTMTAGWQKIFSDDIKIGFVAAARNEMATANQRVFDLATKYESAHGDAKNLSAVTDQMNAVMKQRDRAVFNDKVDTIVAAFFMIMVIFIANISVSEWVALLTRRRPATLSESAPVWLPDYAVAESKPANIAGVVTLSFALARELSGEAHLDRAHAQQAVAACECSHGTHIADEHKADDAEKRAKIYVEMTERRFNGVKRCC